MSPQEKVSSEYCMIDCIRTIWLISSPCILDKVTISFVWDMQDGRGTEKMDSTKVMHSAA
jgi:hypothetical protein